jgi:hypothetical protein
MVLSSRQSGLGGIGSEATGYGLCLSPHYAWVQRLFSLVPGARGYLAKEKLREADVLIRRYAAERLDEAVRELEAARQLLAARAAQAYFTATPVLGQPALPAPGGVADMAALQVLGETLRSLSVEAQRLSSDILYADSGWAPVSAVQAIREPEIRQLCEYDNALIGLAVEAARLASELRAAAERRDNQGVEEASGKLGEVLAALKRLYEERRSYLRFVTHQGLSARQALEKLGAAAGSALEKAKELLAQLAAEARRRLGRAGSEE